MRQTRAVSLMVVLLLLVTASLAAAGQSINLVFGTGPVDVAISASSEVAAGELSGDPWSLHLDILFSTSTDTGGAGVSARWDRLPIQGARIGVGYCDGLFAYTVPWQVEF